MLSKFLVTRSQTNQFQNWLKLQESGIAHSATFTFYQEIGVINFLPRLTLHFMSLSLSKRRLKLYFHSLPRTVILHWQCIGATPTSAPWLGLIINHLKSEKQHWLDFGWLRKLSAHGLLGRRKTLLTFLLERRWLQKYFLF